MVQVLRDPKRQYVSNDVEANKAARFADAFSGLTQTGLKVAQIVGNVSDIQQKNKDKQIEFDAKIATANAKAIQDFQDANDSVIAADNAGKLENDLLRYNEQIKAERPDYIGTREYEQDLRNKADEYNQKYGVGMGAKGTHDYTKSANTKVNAIIESNIRWSFSEKAKKGEEGAKKLADIYTDDAKYFGESVDFAGFDASRANNREKLVEYIDKVSPAHRTAALYEADKKAAMNFLTGVAETNPELAKQYLSSDENLKRVLGSDMLGNVGEIYDSSKRRQIEIQRTQLQSEYDSAADKGTQKRLKKQIDALDKQSESLDPTQRESESLAAIRREITPDIERAIKYGESKNALQQKVSNTKNQVETFKGFVEKPSADVVASMPSDDTGLRTAMTDYYKSSAEIPQNITPILDTAIPALSENCAKLVKMDIKPDGDITTALVTAYSCMTDLNQKGLTNKDMQGMREYISNMVMYPWFKEGTERILNGGLNGNWYPSDAQEIMKKQAKQAQYNAFFGAMKILQDGKENPDQAIQSVSDYIYNARQTTFAKLANSKYGIDVDRLQKELDKGKDAFVDLGNGNMSYFRGFDTNGNILVEPAMTKVKDDRF